MDFLGLFALGVFVGCVATYGLQFISTYRNFAQGLTVILAATLSGTVVLFLDRFAQVGKALGAYSLGLLIALLLVYVPIALANIKSSQASIRWLGLAHIAACVLASLVAVALVLPPAFREVWASCG